MNTYKLLLPGILKILVMTVVALFLAVPAVSAFSLFGRKKKDSEPAVDQLRVARQLLIDADDARDMNKNDKAVGLYRKALVNYEKLAQGFPKWEPDVVEFRIIYCEKQVEALGADPSVRPRIAEPVARENDFLEETRDDNLPAPVAEGGVGAKKEIARLRKDIQNVLVSDSGAGDMAAIYASLAHDLDVVKKKHAGTVANDRSLRDDLSGLDRAMFLMTGRVTSLIRTEASFALAAGETEKAFDLLGDGLSIAPTDSNLRVLFGFVYCEAGGFEHALKIGQELLVSAKNDPNVYLLLGTACLGQGKLKSARDQLEKALRLNAQCSEAHYNMAQILAVSEPMDFKLARAHYRESLKLGGESDELLDALLQPNEK